MGKVLIPGQGQGGLKGVLGSITPYPSAEGKGSSALEALGGQFCSAPADIQQHQHISPPPSSAPFFWSSLVSLDGQMPPFHVFFPCFYSVIPYILEGRYLKGTPT